MIASYSLPLSGLPATLCHVTAGSLLTFLTAGPTACRQVLHCSPNAPRVSYRTVRLWPWLFSLWLLKSRRQNLQHLELDFWLKSFTRSRYLSDKLCEFDNPAKVFFIFFISKAWKRTENAYFLQEQHKPGDADAPAIHTPLTHLKKKRGRKKKAKHLCKNDVSPVFNPVSEASVWAKDSWYKQHISACLTVRPGDSALLQTGFKRQGMRTPAAAPRIPCTPAAGFASHDSCSVTKFAEDVTEVDLINRDDRDTRAAWKRNPGDDLWLLNRFFKNKYRVVLTRSGLVVSF